MQLRHLSLRDFRSYPVAELAFEPGPNVLLGRNGQGKTNVIEAAGYVATLASHRVSSDAPLVRAGAQHAVIRAAVAHEGRELLVELEITPGKANRARINRAPVGKVRNVLGALRCVLFAPEDLAVVRGDPAERRRFTDDLLTATAPRYAGVRADYERLLRQRNALLRSAAGSRRAVDMSTLDVWDEHLSETGAQLLAGRLALVETLRPYLVRSYALLSADCGDLTVDYASPVTDAATDTSVPALAQALRSALTQGRPRELERGITLAGPHRDDLVLGLGGMPTRGYASHGETWSYALSLKLAAYDMLRADGPEPVLILDDVFAELDSTRRRALAAVAAAATQTLITAAVPDDVPAELLGTRFDVADGEVTRVR